MKLLFLIEKLKSSEVFQDYKEKNPSAFFFAGFFSIDLNRVNNSYQLDYSNASGEIMTFSLNSEIKAVPAEPLSKGMPNAIKDELNIDIDNMEEIAKQEAEKKGMKLSKIIAILQNIEGKVIWSLTCMHGMNILKLKIDSASGEILSSETLNLFDVAKAIKKK